jgi:MoaA/NifB/PqqE/SkfB family radical SAM enzyme
MKKFKKVYVEITNICNLNCSFCNNNKREKKFMNVSDFSHIIDEVKKYTDYIYLHVKGEPLLNPNLDIFELTTLGDLDTENTQFLEKNRYLQSKFIQEKFRDE